MSHLEQFRKSRVYLASLYSEKAAALAESVTADPAGSHRSAFTACQIAWGALVDIENAIRAEVLAEDPIDDYYRRRGVAKDGSDARP